MNKTLITAAMVAMLGTSVMADDFDNTAMKMTAVTDNYSISVKDKKTGATEFAIGSEVASLNTTVRPQIAKFELQKKQTNKNQKPTTIYR